MKTYDYIIIGSGPAAKQFVKQMQVVPDKSLLVVEADHFGGTCPNYGCAPKAFLEGATRVALQGQRLTDRGIEAASHINWSDLIKAKLAFFKDWPAESEQQFAQRADTLHGRAEFLNNHVIQVNGRQLSGRKIIIAIGQAPKPLTFPGAKSCHISNDVFSMPSLPHRVAIIGAGYVAIELATLLNAAGAEVTIVQHNHRVLKKFDQELVKQLVASLQQRGISFAFNKDTVGLKQSADGFKLQFADGSSLDSDYVVNCAGRQPDLASLHLERTSIKADRHGVLVDDRLQTSAANVYAIGDAISKKQPALTPVGQFEARYLFRTLEQGWQQPIIYPLIATGVFSFPQLAQVGIVPADASPSYQVERHNFRDGLRGGQNDLDNCLKLVFDKENHLVGAAEISDHAIDDLNYYLPLIALKLKKADLQDKAIGIFPTMGANSINLLH